MDPIDTECYLFVWGFLGAEGLKKNTTNMSVNVANETRNAILGVQIASIEEVLSWSYLCSTFHFYLTLALKNYGPIKCNTYLSSTAGSAVLNAKIKTIEKALVVSYLSCFVLLVSSMALKLLSYGGD